MFLRMSASWQKKLLCSWNSFYAAISPSLTYLAHLLVNESENSHVGWMDVACRSYYRRMAKADLRSFQNWESIDFVV